MNKFEAAVIRRYGTPQNFMRELGLPPKMAFDESGREPEGAVGLIMNLIAGLEPDEVAEVSQCLRQLTGDSRGMQKVAADWLEHDRNERRDEGEDRRLGRDRRRGARDDLTDVMDQPKPGDDVDTYSADKRRMAHDQALPATSFAAMFPNAAKVRWG